MKRRLIFFVTFFLLNLSIKCLKSDLLKIDKVIKGVYNIITKRKLICLTYIGGFRFLREKYGNSRLNFQISEIKEEEKNEDISKSTNDNVEDIKYFSIRHINSHNYLGVTNINTKYSLINTEQIIKNILFSYEWKFEKISEDTFLIKNKIGCYLKENKNSILCSETVNPYNHFHLLRLYSEVIITKEDELILEKEPIDVLIKYIDLNDPNLVREGLHQIKKDEDNEELRYSIRSILKNIPWIRKIFIVMPNEKVRYFKDYELINEKIIYINDKDLLGYDSSNSHAFQYRFWKMKQFGLSDNFIYMDDDCFIGKPLNKSHFFYVENKKVVPAIINTKYEIYSEAQVLKEYEKLKKNIVKNKREQTSSKFMYSVYKTYLFLIKYFKSEIIVPYFTHNAIPTNVNDIKEIYDLVHDSIYRNATLDCKYRHTETLQFQTSLSVYIFNKYKRKSILIDNNYIDNANSIFGNYNYPLFCINTGNNKDYASISFFKTKIVMEKLFPIPTKYEIFNSKIVPNSAFEVIKIIDKKLSELKKIKKKYNDLREKSEIEKIEINYEKCMDHIDMYKAESEAYNSIIKKRTTEIENCKKNYKKFEEKKIGLKLEEENNIMNEKLKRVIESNENHMKIINKYKYENEIYLSMINSLKNKNIKIYIIIYFQLVLIIIIALIIGVYYPLKTNIKNKNNNNEFSGSSDFKRIIREENDEKLKLFD